MRESVCYQRRYAPSFFESTGGCRPLCRRSILKAFGLIAAWVLLRRYFARKKGGTTAPKDVTLPPGRYRRRQLKCGSYAGKKQPTLEKSWLQLRSSRRLIPGKLRLLGSTTPPGNSTWTTASERSCVTLHARLSSISR